MSKRLPFGEFLVNRKLIAHEQFGIVAAFSGTYFYN